MMMKMNKIFSINTILRLAAGAILAAALFGCANMGESPASSAGVTGGAGVGAGAGAGSGSATVSGSLCFSGAMPSEIAALVAPVSLSGASRQSFDNTSRSAFPQTPSASGLTITVYAEEVTESETKLSYSGTVTDDGSGNVSYTVGIPVTSGKKYRVHAVAKKDDEKLLFGTSDLLDFTENAEQFYTSCDITLGAGQSDTGKGGVNLTVNVQGLDVSTAKMIYKPKGSTESISEYGSSGLGGNVRVFSVGFEEGEFDPISAIASGEYTMIFEFYSGAESSENLLYSFTENVSVFDRLVTDTWVKNGAEPWLTPDSSGNIACKITSAMVDGFKLTEIYVDTSKQTTNPNAEDGSYTTASGTFLNPKTSFADALAMLQDASKDYTIFIKGKIGPQTIPDRLKKSGSGGGYTYAKSLTLCGAGDPEDGVPTDIIDAAGAAGTSALTIATTVPVTIKNLKITGGTGTLINGTGSFGSSIAYGGGIYLSATGGSLTLGKGAYVSDNSADPSSGSCSSKQSYGGGICATTPCELNLLSGSVVSANNAKGTGQGGGIAIFKPADSSDGSGNVNIYDGAVIEKNQSNWVGGGIFYFADTSVETTMSGGRISGNTATSNGGAIFGSSGTFTMTGGVIGDDSSTITRAAKYGERTSVKTNKAGDYGGAFYFVNESTVGNKFNINICGGTVAYNCAQKNGGAFYVWGGNLTVQGAQVKWNGAYGVSATSAGGGAIHLKECSELHLDGCSIIGNECYDTYSHGGAICIPHISTIAKVPKVYLKGAVSIPSDAAKKNDIGLMSYSSSSDYMAYPSLYIEGKLTGSGTVATITPTLYNINRQVLQLADGVTDVNFALECYKFAVTPQASATPAQEWAVAGDGYLAKVTTLTGTSIDGFTVDDFNEGDKVVYAFDSSVTNDQIDAFTRKLYNKTENQNLSGKKVGEGSVLDFSKATNLTSLGFSWTNNGVFQPFDIILPPNFDTSKFSNQTFAWAIKNAKNVIATPKASGGLVSEDGVVYNKNKTTIFFYPGGKTATSFVVPDGVTTIPRNSFSYNIYLKNITLPEGVTSIAWNACCATSIESINVPSTVKTIANEAFSNSASFTSLAFANPNGWKLGPSQDSAIPVEDYPSDPADLSDPADAARWYKTNAYNVSGATNSNGYKVLWHD